jgi:hypothetical protein
MQTAMPLSPALALMRLSARPASGASGSKPARAGRERERESTPPPCRSDRTLTFAHCSDPGKWEDAWNTNLLVLLVLSEPGKWDHALELDTHFRQFEGAGRILHSRQHAPTAPHTRASTHPRHHGFTPAHTHATTPACAGLLPLAPLAGLQTSASAPRPGTRASPSSSGCGSAWARRRTTRRTRGSPRRRRATGRAARRPRRSPPAGLAHLIHAVVATHVGHLLTPDPGHKTKLKWSHHRPSVKKSGRERVIQHERQWEEELFLHKVGQPVQALLRTAALYACARPGVPGHGAVRASARGGGRAGGRAGGRMHALCESCT